MKNLIIGLGLICLMNAAAFAQSEDIDLNRIVVTPYKFDGVIYKTPASVTVITQSQIKSSNAQSIPDLLRTQTALDVKDYYGNGTKVFVDMRGFGEMAGSNTLVLIDGRRVNEIDWSGVDWTQIPLDAIERIEIVRGKGAVLYGDNATNGVINIVTKTGKGKPAFEFASSGGSYDMYKERLSLSGSENKFSYFLNTSAQSTHGYRQNSNYKAKDILGKFGYDFNDKLNMLLSAGYHDSDYGMPGALRESDLRTLSRRDTKFPEDTASEQDGFVALNAKTEISDEMGFDFQFSYRSRRVDNQQLSSKSIDERKLNTFGFTPSFTLSKEIMGSLNKITLGYDFYKNDSMIDAYSFNGASFYQGAKTRDTDIDKDTSAFYLQDQFSLSRNVVFSAGYRYEKAKYTFNSLPQDGPWTADPWWMGTRVEDSLKVDEEALDFGLSYLYKENSNLFVSYSRNFRFPTTDEYYSLWASPPVNINLLAQTASTYEIGLNHQFSAYCKTRLNLFNMYVRNELYYDPLTYSNNNYDKTQHRGLEAELELRPFNKLILNAGYTFTEALFKAGTYNKNQVPIVPRHKVSAAITWKPDLRWQFNAIVNYVGRQYFINDQAHNYPRLADYLTLDIKASFNLPKLELFFGINNLLNREYSEYGAISTMYNERGYYPSCERNFVAGGIIKF